MSGLSTVDASALAQTITTNIQRITRQTNEIQQLMRHFGTTQDTTELRQTIQEKQKNGNHLAKATEKYIKEFSSLSVHSDQRQRKIQRDRLISEFSNSLAMFQQVQRDVAQKEKEFVERVRAGSRVSGGGMDDGFGRMASSFPSEIQAQTYEENFTEEDLQLIQERESAIRRLESDITDINQIFRDLGLMVHEQGDMIDSIEANIENAELNVQSATQQLSRAANYQVSCRKKIIILIAVLVVLAVVLGLIIWASVKS